MPQPHKNNPDMYDVQAMLASVGQEYHAVIYFVTRLRSDFVEVIAKAYGPPYTQDGPVLHVALQTWPVSVKKDMNVVFYTLAFDIWLQFDGGGATAAKRGPTYRWDGRVEVPRRRSRS